MQKQKLSDGYRYITHLMIDAGANNFTVVDPVDGEVGEQLSSLKFFVSNTKFTGEVHIVYHYSLDTFSIAFYGTEVEAIKDVYFDDLAPQMEKHIDDDLWRQIKVNAITKAKQRKKF